MNMIANRAAEPSHDNLSEPKKISTVGAELPSTIDRLLIDLGQAVERSERAEDAHNEARASLPQWLKDIREGRNRWPDYDADTEALWVAFEYTRRIDFPELPQDISHLPQIEQGRIGARVAKAQRGNLMAARIERKHVKRLMKQASALRTAAENEYQKVGLYQSRDACDAATRVESEIQERILDAPIEKPSDLRVKMDIASRYMDFYLDEDDDDVEAWAYKKLFESISSSMVPAGQAGRALKSRTLHQTAAPGAEGE